MTSRDNSVVPAVRLQGEQLSRKQLDIERGTFAFLRRGHGASVRLWGTPLVALDQRGGAFRREGLLLFSLSAEGLAGENELDEALS